MKQRRVKSGPEIGKCPSDLQLIVNCFQEGFTEAGNAKHLPGSTMDVDQQDQVTSSETNHRKLAVELTSKLKTMSRYERVFRSLETDGIFVKLSKIPGGAVGLS